MNIQLLVDQLRPYGAQRVCLDLAEAFQQLGHRVQILTYADGPSADVEHLLIGKRGRGVISSIRLATDVRRAARDWRTEVLISFMTEANIAASMASAGAPWTLLTTEHNLPTKYLPNYGRRRAGVQSAAALLYRRAHRVVAVSNAVRIDVLRNYRLPEDAVSTIYNPINIPRLTSAARTPIEHPWLHPTRHGGGPTLVSVGAFKLAKGQAWLVRALSRPASGNVRVLFIGDGNTRSAVERLAKSLDVADRVSFVGWQDHPAAWIARADGLVLSSEFEGFGLVVAEAAALGIPVVGRGSPGCLEVLEAVGARIVGSSDVEGLATALRTPQLDGSKAASWLATLKPVCVSKRYLSLAKAVGGSGGGDFGIPGRTSSEHSSRSAV